MRKVLIVEDNETTRMSLTLLLNAYNYWVKTCGSVRESISAITQGSMPDVVVADYFLDDGTGLKVIEYLRSLPGGDKVSCLLATAATPDYLEPYRERMRELRVGVVFKPYEVENMLEAIARMAYPEELNAPNVASIKAKSNPDIDLDKPTKRTKA